MSPTPSPPRIARQLLRRVLPSEARDAVDGDLYELYTERRAVAGAASATLWYWLEALSFAMRFTFDRIAGVARGLVGRDTTPSALDLKLAARMLAKSPGLTIVGGFGIAIGVALGAGAYAVINTYFYPEIPLSEGDRIVNVANFNPRRQYKDSQALHDFLVWRRELHSVVDLAAFTDVKRNLITPTGQAEPIKLAEMTASGFRVARVPPLLGRFLLESDELPGANPVMVIGYDVWQARFAGDPRIIGREMRLGRTLYTIVGVMPRGFAFPVNHSYWVPLRIDPAVNVEPGMGPGLDVFGRLAHGATRESAQAELSVIGRRIAAQAPAAFKELEPRVVPYTDIVVNAEAEGESASYAIVRFLIAFLLIVVAMNVAVLVYARTVARTGEIAIRTALGATRGRIVAQLFVEAFVLSGWSALVGLGIVAIGLRLFDDFLASGGGAPFWIRSGLSSGTILYALILAVVTAVIIGVIPAVRATGAQLREAMGSMGSGTKARLGPTWTALIVGQIAIAVAILPPALTKGGQTARMALTPAGFASGEYVSADFVVERDVDATAVAAPNDAAADSARAIVGTLLDRLATEPGVVGVSVSDGPPWDHRGAQIDVDGTDGPSRKVRVNVVDTSFFRLFDVRMLAGRNFSAADGALPPLDRPVIVNRTFVGDLLGSGDPIGRRVRYRSYNDEVNRWLTIVGVVEDFPADLESPHEESVRTMYHLTMPTESPNATLTVRLRGKSPETFAPTLRRIATSVDPMLQLSQVNSLDGLYREASRAAAQLALVIILVSGSVLLLSAAGIHALMSFTVNQRRREIGIRSALGASGRRVLGSVLARAARQLSLGVGLGLALSIALDLATGGELMEGTGLLVVPATAVFMLVVGLLAAMGPARRGLEVQPTEALRSE
jgi:predicted permease